MTLALSQVLSTTLIASLFFLINRLTEKKISALGRYLAGLILAVAFLIPLRIPIIPLEIPKTYVPQFEAETSVHDEIAPLPVLPLPDDFDIKTETPLPPEDPQTTPKTALLSFEGALILLYLLGAMTTLFCILFRYCRTVKHLQRCGRAPTEEERNAYLSVCQRLGMKNAPRLLVCPKSIFSSPVTFGVFKQTILVSDVFSIDDLPMILGHELTHCKRRDSMAKVFFAILGSAYWFHPLIHLFIRTMNELCESSCDELFLSNADKETKQTYCRLLVLTAVEGRIRNKPIFTAFKGGKKQMKKRLSNILTTKKQKGAILIVALAIVIVLLSIFVYAVTPHVRSKKTSIPSLSLYQPELTEYIDEILQNHNHLKHNKEDLRIWDFEIAYAGQDAPYLTFELICENGDTRYTQNIEFASHKMFIYDPQKNSNFSHADFSTYLSLADLEKIVSALDITALIDPKTEIKEFFFTYEGYGSPSTESPINNKPAPNYILNSNGLSLTEYAEAASLPVFMLQINESFYWIFIE